MKKILPMTRLVPFSTCNLIRADLISDEVTSIANFVGTAVKFIPVHGNKSFFSINDNVTSTVFWDLDELQKHFPNADREFASISLIGSEPDGTKVMCVDCSSLDANIFEPLGISLSVIFDHVDKLDDSIQIAHSTQMAIARGLIYWHANNKFCSKCGFPTRLEREGTARRCSNEKCLHQIFPRQDPAVITTCTVGDYALLGRKSVYPSGRFSTVAGFVEIGETLEATVCREIEEETGVQCEPQSVQYVCSQPWPFPQSYMMAFTAEAKRRPDEEDATSDFAPHSLFADTTLDLERLNLVVKPEVPLITVGGGWVHDSTGRFFLPKAAPPPHELEDARWFHKDVLNGIMQRLENGEAFEKGHIMMPMRTGISYVLIKDFIASRDESTIADRRPAGCWSCL